MGPALRRERISGLAHGGRALRIARVTLGTPGLFCFFFFRLFCFAALDCQGRAPAALFGEGHLPGHVLEALGRAPDEPEGLCGTLRCAFLITDARLRSLWPRGEPGGSTAVTLLVSPRFLYLAHCCDFRAVLSLSGAVVFCTEDHRPSSPRNANVSKTRAAPSASGVSRAFWQRHKHWATLQRGSGRAS